MHRIIQYTLASLIIIILLGLSQQSGHASQQNPIDEPPYDYFVYLPFVSTPPPPKGVYGIVTENGVPVEDNIALTLHLFNGTSSNAIAMTGTWNNGEYSFPNVPSLSPGQYYYVQFFNSNPNPVDPNRLWMWRTRNVETFQSGGEVLAGNFDIGEINLVSPVNNATVALPYSFQWIQRAASPSDSYRLDMYTVATPRTYYLSSPLGNTGSYTLSSLPQGFSPNQQLLWEIRAYSPDGGYGISNSVRYVTFSNTGLDTTDSFLTLPLTSRPFNR